MQHSFSHFLRHGGDGQYEIVQRHGHLIGRRVGLSLKPTFPNYTALRADFSERLDQVISENTRMLLNALTPPDTVPTVSEAELRDVSDAKSEALDAWDARLEIIFGEYQNHPQRLRPLRTVMEERLVRAFAGLINQLRQENLGIQQYIWRSRDDAKVRDSHAAYDNRVFRWNNPPEGGHPGEAHNCRCYAEPVLPGVQSNVVLADFAPTADGVPALDLTEAMRGLRALTGFGAALLASDALQNWTQAMRDRRVDDAGARLGVDVTTVEGRLAATAYALVQEGISSGGYPIEELGLPNHTGSPIPDDPTDNIVSTPIPEEAGPNIVDARPGATTTPDGNRILPHGGKGDGREYIGHKGHDVEQIDEIIANPRPDLSGIVEGRGRYKGQDMTLLTGQDGHWVLLDPDGNVFAVSNRNLPLGHKENQPDDIIRPLEQQ